MNTEIAGVAFFMLGNVVMVAACLILNKVLSAITDRMLQEE